MKLENSLTIPVPAAEAWKVLLDLERVAPCVPGATLTAREDDVFHGRIKVKLGPIALTYHGTVTFLSRDEEAKVAVLAATGRETRGNGTAKATVTCRLEGTGDATRVHVETDLAITGKPAQFGRGALAEVAGTLIGQFAGNLAAEIGGPQPPPPVDVPSAPLPVAAGPTPVQSAPVPGAPAPGTPARRPVSEPIDLAAVAGGAVARRAGPATATAAATLLLLLLLRRYLRRRRPQREETRK